ncbi:MAG: glycosyltransferase family 4 protein, partial [Fervidobacterium sp.]
KNFLESHPEYKGRLFFLGFRKDAPELMADFDVFLLTSDSEGFPLVLLEALYHGIIPIMTKNGAQVDVIRNGENGFLYETEEEAEELIRAILDGKQEIERLRQRVLKTAEQYSFERFIDRYRNLYDY